MDMEIERSQEIKDNSYNLKTGQLDGCSFPKPKT